MKVPYSHEKMPQKNTFISKEERQVLGFNAGRDRLALLFCANVVWLRIRTAVIYKPAKP